MNYFLIFVLFLSASATQALPIDWHGALGFDTNLLGDFRRISKTTDDTGTAAAGTMEYPLGAGGNANASWQTYLFRLEPHIIVNDTATIKAEFTSGYGRGGRFGDATLPTGPNQQSLGSSLYLNNVNQNGNDSELTFNKLYAEIYADTATYLIGRHTYHFGLGAVVNSGEGMWDRFPYLRDGITVKIKIGNFLIEPYWARQAAGNSLTKATRVKDNGLALNYNNVNQDMSFGALYSIKKSGANNPVNNQAGASLGSTDVKLIDLYFKKSFTDFDFGVEVPILSGEIGNVYTANTRYKTKAIIFQSNLKATESWSFGFDAGKVDGDSGDQSSYEAMFLNPNFQIANLLFRYNLRAISNTTNGNVYESYINNTLYAKLRAHYKTERWQWNFAAIYAQADEVALGGGDLAYNHERNLNFTSTTAQSKDMGLEIDSSFVYQWNSEISIGGAFGWLFTGDYFAYTNSAAPNELKNAYVLQLNTMVRF